MSSFFFSLIFHIKQNLFEKFILLQTFLKLKWNAVAQVNSHGKGTCTKNLRYNA
jgi:hypothetical protein